MDPTYPEEFEEYIARNGDTTYRIVDGTTADRILIVGHGATVIGVAAGLTGSREGVDIPPPLASLTQFIQEGDEDDWRFVRSGDTSHLE